MRLILNMALGFIIIANGTAISAGPAAVDISDFYDPPLEYKSRPLWFWNKKETTSDEIKKIMTSSRDLSGYFGFGILPAVEPEKYLTGDYFNLYGTALETAVELGQKMCLYDEYWFPSGSAGGQFARKFPELVMKRLDMQSENVEGPLQYQAAVSNGTLMGAVAMNAQTFERIDITESVSAGHISWNVPAGKWKVMIFTCVPEGNIMDYMNRAATEKFLQITHDQYFNRFGKYFGNTIDSVFYDEPTLYRNQGRAWTETFNRKFEEKSGENPVVLYPALWMDIGPDTAAARVAMFGFRAELFSTEYIGVMDEWCRAHRVNLTGHMDQEQVENTTSISGDLMKVFKHQAIPGIDEVFAYRRTQRAYKLISSAAYNWDKKLVMSETYGGIGKMPVEMLYRMGMDLYAKGINFMVPHAVWTDDKHITFEPELSWRTEPYASALPDYNRWIGRLNLMLQGGRHVADIAVLYPIAALQAGTYFDSGRRPYDGGPAVAEADYMRIGEMLSLDIRQDFIYLHPEVLDEKCSIKKNRLLMKNDLHAGKYGVLILPGAATVYAGNMAMAREFFDKGGMIIATTKLPVHSAEFGKDSGVLQDVKHIFGIDPAALQENRSIKANASSIFSTDYQAYLAVDGSTDSRWNSSDKSQGEQWLKITFPEKEIVTSIWISEVFDRVRKHSIQFWHDSTSEWKTIMQGDKIGMHKVCMTEPFETSKLRLVMSEYDGNCVSISEFTINGKKNNAIFNENPKGGRACFIQNPDKENLRQALDSMLPVPDVSFEPAPVAKDGNFSYIHMSRANREVYFLANSGMDPVETTVCLRGKMKMETWDPHNGSQAKAEYRNSKRAGQDVTMIHVRLNPCRSVFLVGK